MISFSKAFPIAFSSLFLTTVGGGGLSCAYRKFKANPYELKATKTAYISSVLGGTGAGVTLFIGWLEQPAGSNHMMAAYQNHRNNIKSLAAIAYGTLVAAIITGWAVSEIQHLVQEKFFNSNPSDKKEASTSNRRRLGAPLSISTMRKQSRKRFFGRQSLSSQLSPRNHEKEKEYGC